MRALIRNLTPSTTLDFDFTGFDITPIGLSVLPRKSGRIETSLSILELRQVPDIAAALTGGQITISISGDTRALS